MADWAAIQVATEVASPVAMLAIGAWIKLTSRDVAVQVVAEAEKRLELLLQAKLAQFRVDLLVEMNGKYLRTREQLKDNDNFQRQLDSHNDRIHEIEQRPEGANHRHPAYEQQLEKHDLDLRNLTSSLARRT